MRQKLKQQFNTLAIFIHSLVSQYATFELQTNCLVYGKVDHVDDDLNVTLGDVTLQRLNSRCSSQLEMMFIHSKTIRYIHLPDDLNVDESVTKQFQRTMAKNSVNFRPINRLSAIPDSASRTNSNNQHASGKFDPEATQKRSNGDNGRQVSFTNVGLEKTDQKVVAGLNSSTANNYHHSRSTQSSPSCLPPLPLLPSGEGQCESIPKFSPTINKLYNEETSPTFYLDQNNLSMNSPCLYTPVPTDHDPAEEYIVDRHEESPKFEFTESAPASDFTNRKRNNPHFDAVSETVDKSDISSPALKKVKIEKASGDKPKSDQPLTKSKVSTSSVVPSPDATDDEEETERRNNDDDNLTLKELERAQKLFDQSGHAKAEIIETTHEVSKATKIDSPSRKMENGARRSKAPLNKRDKELNELLESTVQFAPRYLTRRSRNAQPEAANKSNTKRKNANKGEAVKYTEVISLRRGRSSRGNGRNK